MKLTGVQSTDYPELAAEHPIAHDYAAGRTHNAVSIGTGATSAVDLITKGHSRLASLAELAATVTAADLTCDVYPYLDDGVTLSGAPLKALTDSTVVSDGVNVWQSRVYDLAGVDKVSVKVKNANVASKSGTHAYFLQR